MEEINKQCAGIDCSKKDFAVTLSVSDRYQEIQHLSSRSFANNDLGFKAFNNWIGKLYKKSIPMLFVMEATGVYHERLAHFLANLGCPVSIVVPKRAKDFSKTLKIKKLTDKIASQYLAIMGLEKKLDIWNPPHKEYSELKHLTREKEQIQSHIVMLKNYMEAEKSAYVVHKESLQRFKQTLNLLKKQKTEILKQINNIIAANNELQSKVDKVTTIPGVGILTAATIIGETNGFSQVRSKRQLVSYAGYDVMNQESGTSVKTKSRISKRGNKHIRKAMHMPALSSISHANSSKATFSRIVSKTGIKMKGVVAVQRKLLVLIYTLWKNDAVYDPNYEEIKEGDLKPPRELDHVRS
jgi:transposase